MASDGHTYSVTNEEAAEAAALYEREEGVDIDPAAAVAVASLRTAVTQGTVGKGDSVLLNVTGGGERKLKADFGDRLNRLQPWATVDCADIGDEAVNALMEKLRRETSKQ